MLSATSCRSIRIASSLQTDTAKRESGGWERKGEGGRELEKGVGEQEGERPSLVREEKENEFCLRPKREKRRVSFMQREKTGARQRGPFKGSKTEDFSGLAKMPVPTVCLAMKFQTA